MFGFINSYSRETAIWIECCSAVCAGRNFPGGLPAERKAVRHAVDDNDEHERQNITAPVRNAPVRAVTSQSSSTSAY